jgi:hypothetical protein
MAESFLSYNGIILKYIKTVGFRQEPIYDASHTDLLYQKITLTVQGVINPCINSPSNASFGVCKAPQEILAIRQRMLTPRGIFGPLIYNIDGINMITSPLIGRVRDEANGPKPIRFDVTKVDGGKTLFVEFEVETYINECNGTLCTNDTRTVANRVLSNRFSVQDSFDTNYLTTRTINGILILSGVNTPVNETLSADISKQLLQIFGLHDKWKRDSIGITQEPDGLTYRYVIVDKELNREIPSPAVSIDAQYNQVFGILGAGCTENEVSVTIQGEPNAEYADLLKIASRIIFSRINPQGFNAGSTAKTTPSDGEEFITGGSISEDIYNRKLTIKLKTTSAPNKKYNKDGLQVITHRLDNPIDMTGILDPNAKDKGRSPKHYKTYLVACALGNPCAGNFYSEDDEKKPKAQIKIYEKSEEEPHSPSDDLIKQTGYSPGQSEAPYSPSTVYEYDLETNNHTFQMSVAKYGTNVPAQFVTVAAPTSVKHVRWIATRTGLLPELPHPETNDILVSTKIFARDRKLSKDGITWIYTVRGEYCYAQVLPYQYGTIDLPRNPKYEGNNGAPGNQIPGNAFKRDILVKYT